MRGGIAIATAAATAVLVAGCSGSGPRAAPTHGALAPPITLDQLFVAPYAGKPCTLLTADQANRRGLVPPGTVTRPASGPGMCQWPSRLAANPVFTAGVDPARGLEDRYRQRAAIGTFEPTEISGYPALHTTVEANGPALGHCTTEVGVADRALLLVSVDYGAARGVDAADPCADADTVALEIMGHLKAGGG